MPKQFVAARLPRITFTQTTLDSASNEVAADYFFDSDDALGAQRLMLLRVGD